MDAVPRTNPDIENHLARMARCRRCTCQSCSVGYENHSHRCTQGPECVETQERLQALVYLHSVVAGRARHVIRDLQADAESLRVRVAQLEAIHHG